MGQTQPKTDTATESESQGRVDELRFCVVADWHGAHEPFSQLASRLIEERPEFVLVPGDLVNAKGDDSAPWEQFFSGIRPLLDAGIVYYPVPGNHDFDGDIAAAQQQWIKRLNLPGDQFFYSFDESHAHFTGLCVTSKMLHDEFDLPEGRMTQFQWFQGDLESSRDARWRFIFHHEPGAAFCRLSAPEDGAGTPDVSESVEPLAWREGVDLIFRGHQHLYERTYPVNPSGKVRDDRRGVVLITVGGGNINYRPIDPMDAVPRWFDAVISVHQMHYLTIQLAGDRLEAEAKNLDGEVFDRFTIRKLPDGSRDWEGLPPTPVFLVENQTQPLRMP